MASDSDINSLISSGFWWELAEYVSLAAVFIGVAVQSVHEFTRWFRHIPWWGRNGRRASAFILIAASAAVLVTTIKANGITDLAIAFVGEREAETRHRAANLEKQAAQFREQAANAEARLKHLEPRMIGDRDAFIGFLSSSEPASVKIFFHPNDFEAEIFASQLYSTITKAGWTTSPPSPVPNTSLSIKEQYQNIGAFPYGVIVQNRTISQEKIMDAIAWGSWGEKPKIPLPAFDALIAAFFHIQIQTFPTSVPSLSEGEIRIIVAQRY